EQDQFVIRKLRFRNDFEIVASEYKTFGRGLKLPLHRDLVWEGKSIRITVANASSLANNPKLKEYVSPKSLLTTNRKESIEAIWPDDKAIREFYTKLRS